MAGIATGRWFDDSGGLAAGGEGRSVLTYELPTPGPNVRSLRRTGRDCCGDRLLHGRTHRVPGSGTRRRRCQHLALRAWLAKHLDELRMVTTPLQLHYGLKDEHIPKSEIDAVIAVAKGNRKPRRRARLLY